MSATTLISGLHDAAERGGPAEGFTFIDRKEREDHHCWQSLLPAIARAAGALREAGVRSGDRVGIILPTGPHFIAAFFGCQWLGAIPVPLYPPVRLGRLDEYHARTVAMLRAVQARALISDARIRRMLGQVRAAADLPLGLIPAESIDTGPQIEAADVAPGDLAMVQFSSGTTQDPKAVALTHAQVLSNARAVLDAIAEPRGEPITGVCWLPLYHDMGLIGCIFTAVLCHGRLGLMGPEVFLLRPALWLRAIARLRARVSPAPNFAYALCTERIRDEELGDLDLSCWRYALNGAEPVSPAVLRAFEARFTPRGLPPHALRPVYGLAEASLAVTFPPASTPWRSLKLDRGALADGRAEPGHDTEIVSCGRPLEGFDVAIRDPEGHPLPEDRVGRLWVRGPSLMQKYLDGRDAPRDGPWLDTGDLAFLHQGELFVTGRAKDCIVIRGQNHLPQDIERAVDSVKGVRTGCAAAVSDLGPEGERLILLVEVRKPREDLAERCAQAVRAATGLDPALVLTLAPGTLPRTSSGKIRRRAALAQLHAKTLLPPKKVTPWMLAGAMAKSLLASWKPR